MLPKILSSCVETKVRDTDIRVSSVARRVRWKQLMREHAGKIDLDLAKQFEADHYDSFLRKDYPGVRCFVTTPNAMSPAFNTDVPFSPSGTVDGKVVDAKMAREMSFARAGARPAAWRSTPRNSLPIIPNSTG